MEENKEYKNGLVLLGIFVPPEYRAEIKSRAALQQKTIAEYICEALDEKAAQEDKLRK